MIIKIFDSARHIALSVGLIILLPLITVQIADIVFPKPNHDNIVTTEWSKIKNPIQEVKRKKSKNIITIFVK